MKKLFKEIVSAGLLVSLLAGFTGASLAGATTTLKVVQTPPVSVYTSQGSADTTLVVTPVPVDLDGNVLTMSSFGSSPTVTVDPGVSGIEEIESFTTITNNGNGTATLGGETRDLQSQYPYTSTNTGKQHGGGAVVVFSNNPQLYGRLAAPENDNVWTGLQTFSLANQPVYNGNPSFTNPLALIDKQYADQLSIVGAPTSTEITLGVVRLATFGQVGTGVASSTSGAPYVIENKFASSTYNGSTVFQGEIPALRSTKDIDPNFIATSSANTYNFGGAVSIATSTIFTLNVGTVNATSSINLNGNTLKQPNFGGTGSDGALTCSSGTTNINLAGASVVVKNYTSISITGTCYVEITNGATGGSEVVLKSQGNAVFTSSAAPMLDASSTGSSGAGGVSGGAQSGVTAPSSAAFSSIAGGTGGIGGGNGVGGGASAPTTFVYYPFSNASQTPYQNIFVGSGGGSGGCAGSTPTCKGGNGGNGGGAVIVEVGGALNFTTTNGISVAGQNGTSTGSISGGSNVIASGGGGGGGGFFMMLYNSLTALTGTVNVSGGTGSLGVISGSPSAINGGGGGANPISNGSTGSSGSTGAGSVGGTGGAGYSLIGLNPR